MAEGETPEEGYREPAKREEPEALGDQLRAASASASFRFADEPFEGCKKVHEWLKALEATCKEAASAGRTRSGPWRSSDGIARMSVPNGEYTRFETTVEAWARRQNVRVSIVPEGKEYATVAVA